MNDAKRMRPGETRKGSSAADRRQSKRVPAEIMVEVETRGQRTYRRTANIGMGGIAFHTPIPFKQGARISLTLRLVGQDEPMRVFAEVVGVDRQERGVRVRFLSLPAEVRVVLQAHLELFDAPTQVGIPPAPRADDQDLRARRVREGILLVEGGLETQDFRIRGSDKVIGRDAREADFVIDHPSVSRRHAVIYLQNNRHVVVDLSSTNGITYKGKPIKGLVLRDKMMFRIGTVQLQYFVTKMV